VGLLLLGNIPEDVFQLSGLNKHIGCDKGLVNFASSLLGAVLEVAIKQDYETILD
jgi:hypothetical protein